MPSTSFLILERNRRDSKFFAERKAQYRKGTEMVKRKKEHKKFNIKALFILVLGGKEKPKNKKETLNIVRHF